MKTYKEVQSTTKKIDKVFCDFCGKDISVDDGEDNFKLFLESRPEDIDTNFGPFDASTPSFDMYASWGYPECAYSLSIDLDFCFPCVTEKILNKVKNLKIEVIDY